MRKLILFSSIILASLFTSAQTTVYDANAVLREAKGFNSIEVSDGIDLHLSYGEEAIAVSASEAKFRDKIVVAVQNGILKLSYDESNKFSVNGKRNLRAYVSFRSLKAISASGGSDVVIEGSLKANNLSINISGGSDFKGAVEVENLVIDQSGGSDVTISGKAKALSINSSGGSDFNGYSLVAEVCDVEASGGSDVEVTANKEITARASGASDITYKGSAALKSSKSSGASSVSKG
ncbi:MAG TPA: head GIN domain-containing protein [Chitinophagaceae bacterium]|nr:head GIN domain-containing protein [Chitinophagaceae bacterium]